MALECKTVNDGLILNISGEIDHHRARVLMQSIDFEIESRLPRSLVADLSQVTFMDSSGIALLLRMQWRMSELEGSLRVIGVPNQAARVLRSAGLQRMLEIEFADK